MQTIDGAVFEGASPAELVEAMRQASFTDTGTVTAFMAATAMRVRGQSGQSVRSGNPADFVEDLLALGFLKPVDVPNGKTGGGS